MYAVLSMSKESNCIDRKRVCSEVRYGHMSNREFSRLASFQYLSIIAVGTNCKIGSPSMLRHVPTNNSLRCIAQLPASTHYCTRLSFICCEIASRSTVCRSHYEIVIEYPMCDYPESKFSICINLANLVKGLMENNKILHYTG